MPDLFDASSGPPPVYGCIEAGGTKFMVGVLVDPADLAPVKRIPTAAPVETLGACLDFLAKHAPPGGFAAIGIASFGPLQLTPGAANRGQILDTTKPGWSGINLIRPFVDRFKCPVGVDTDVNGAALAEYRWGAAAGTDIATYLTVGTGIGGGAVVEGRTVRGHRHPEMGHIRVCRHPHDDFIGACPYHGACAEGLASGMAIQARWGRDLSSFAQDDPAHDIIASYIAQVIVAQQAMLSPDRLILGGGVMATPGLLGRVRDAAARLGNGYFAASADYDQLVVEPGLGARSGLLGALALAMDAAR